MNVRTSTALRIAEEIGARLSKAPFIPFAVETEEGLYHVAFPWQAIVSEVQFFFGEPSPKAHGCIDARTTIVPLVQVTAVVEVEGTKGSIAESATPIAASASVLRLYTDGACQGNPGPGGWGFIIKDSDGAEIGRGSGGERPTTNNRMELTSVISGLEVLDPKQSVRVITDSQYVAKGLSEWMAGWKKRGWKRKTAKGLEPVANEDLWRRLDELAASRKVVCEWVRGHAGHPENEECDRMAVEAALNV